MPDHHPLRRWFRPRRLPGLLSGEEGPTAVEYALMLGFLAAAIVLGFLSLSPTLVALWVRGLEALS